MDMPTLPDPNAQAPLSMGTTEAPTSPGGMDPNARQQLAKSLNTVEVTGEDLAKWWKRIEASEKRTKNWDDKWDILYNEYLPTIEKSGTAESVKTNLHFRNVETKKGQLFVRSPDVVLAPKPSANVRQPAPAPPMVPGQPPPPPQAAVGPADALPIRQAVVNDFMGPDYIDGVRLMDECLLDVLAWSGISPVKIAYTAVSKPVQRPQMGPDPNWQPPAPAPSTLGLAPTPQPPQIPQMGPDGSPLMGPTIQVPVFQKWDADRFSAKKLLLDELLRSSRVEKHSRWIGHRFFMDRSQVIRQFGVSEDDLKGADKDDRLFVSDSKSGDNDNATTKDLIGGYELFYLGSYFLDSEWHPQAMYQLIVIDNIKDRTIVSRKSPDQTFDPQTGQLSDDSLIGFPIKVLMLRDTVDGPFSIADSGFTNSSVKQLNTNRRQSVQLRDAAIGKYFYDTDAIDTQDLDTIKNGEVGAFIGLKAGRLLQGADKIFMSTAQIRQTPDTVRLDGTLKQEIDETLGISAVQAGSPLDTVRSATEVAAVQADSSGRQEKEKARVVAFYLDIVRAVDTLVFRYATGDRYVAMAGQQGAIKLQMWNKVLAGGCYSFSIKVNSQLNDDIAKDRQTIVNGYNIVGPDPLTNRAPWLRLIARAFGLDPNDAVKDPDVVMAEQAQQAMGMPVGQPPHPNSGPINKHQADKTGNMPNGPGTHAAPTPILPGHPAAPPPPHGAAPAAAVGQLH